MKATFVEIETGFTGWGRFKKMIPTMIVRHPELVSEKSATIEAMLLLASKNLSADRVKGIVEMKPKGASEAEIEEAPSINDNGHENYTKDVLRTFWVLDRKYFKGAKGRAKLIVDELKKSYSHLKPLTTKQIYNACIGKWKNAESEANTQE